MKPNRLANLGAKLAALSHSIRIRLVLWFTVILALVLSAFSAFVYYNQARDLRTEALDQAEAKLARVDELLRVGLFEAQEHGDLATVNVRVPDGLLQPADVFILIGPGGTVMASQGPIPPQDAVALTASSLQGHAPRGDLPAAYVSWKNAQGQPGQDYVFLVRPISSDGQLNGFILFGSQVDPANQLYKLRLTLLAGSLLTLAVALAGGFWLADRAMRPVQTITHAARTISETDLSRRLNMTGQDELGELANTFDAMLARLQAAFERQRQFVADASHELRTPLTIVNLEASRALAAKRAPLEYERALGVIRSENDFMSRLVGDLLTLARMDSGQATLDMSALDLSDVALEAAERLASLAERNGVKLEAGGLSEAAIRGDRQYLLQMISNLVENGIKYAAGDDRRVLIETGTTAESAWVKVGDNGPGIPPEHLAHLFDRFYRADAARTRSDQDKPDAPIASGSGLGLSIVRWIAEAHGGRVEVQSQLGIGTRFTVTLPAAD